MKKTAPSPYLILTVLVIAIVVSGVPRVHAQDMGLNTTITVTTPSRPNAGSGVVDWNPKTKEGSFPAEPGATAADRLIESATFQFTQGGKPAIPSTPGPAGVPPGQDQMAGERAASQYPPPDPSQYTGAGTQAVTSTAQQRGAASSVPTSPAAAASPQPQGVQSASNNGSAGQAVGSDPVNPFNGEFVIRERDLFYPGVGMDFALFRVYRSRWTYDGPLGFGWDHSYNQRIVESKDRIGSCYPEVQYMCGDGRVIRFVPGLTPDSYSAPAGVPLKLARGKDAGGDYWTVKDKDGIQKRFDSRGLLASITDLNGNSLGVEWEPSLREDGYRVKRVVDTIGKSHDFSYAPEGFLKEVSSSGTRERVSYEIDARHDLIRVTLPGRGPQKYVYSPVPPVRSAFPTESEVQEQCQTACGPKGADCRGGACDDAAALAQSTCVQQCDQSRKDCADSCSTQCPALCKMDEEKQCEQRCKDTAAQACEQAAEKSCRQFYDREGEKNCTNACDNICEGSCGWSYNFSVEAGGTFTGCVFTHSVTACWYHANGNDCMACCRKGEFCKNNCNRDQDCYDVCKNRFFHGTTKSACTPNHPGCVERDADWCVKNVDMNPCYKECGRDCPGACATGCRYGCHPNITCAEVCAAGLPPEKVLGEQCRATCFTACHDKLADPQGRRYGRDQDLGHNLIEAYGADKRLFVKNTYGQDPYSPNFDAVVEQNFAWGGKVVFQYHDLVAESLPGSTSQVPWVSPRKDFEVRDICSWECADPVGPNGVPVPLSSCKKIRPRGPSVKMNPSENELPVSATVVTDPENQMWIMYFDREGRPIRSENVSQGAVYETNYHPLGDIAGTRLPMGSAYCQHFDADGDLTDQFILPAPSAEGSQTPVHQTFKWQKNPRRLLEVSDPRDETRAVKKMGWGPKGNLISTEVTGAGKWKFTPDSRGRVVRMESPAKSVTRLEYDPKTGQVNALIKDETGPQPDKTIFEYDDAANVKTVTQMGVTGQNMEWLPGRRLGRIRTQWDSARPESVKSYTFTPDGRVESVKDGYSLRKFTYHESGLVENVEESDLSGAEKPQTWCMKRDPSGQVSSIVFPEGNQVDYRKFPNGSQVQAQTVRTLHVKEFSRWDKPCEGIVPAPSPTRRPNPPEAIVDEVIFDMEGRPWMHTDSAGASTWFHYDGFGRLARTVDKNQNQVRRDYDETGALKWEARYAPTTPMFYGEPKWDDDGLMAWTRYTYGPAGNIRRIARMHATPSTQPPPNRTYPYLYPVGTGWATMIWDFDWMKNTLTITDPDGNTVVNAYDGLGRSISTLYPDGEKVAMSYPTPTRVVKATDGAGRGMRETLEFNGLGLPTRWYNTLGQLEHSIDYDDRGLPIQYRKENGGVTKIEWDAYGRRRSFQKWAGNSLLQKTNYAFDRNSRLTSITDGLGNQTRFSLDYLDRQYKITFSDKSTLETLSFLGNSLFPDEVKDAAGTVFKYRYNPLTQMIGLDIDQRTGLWQGVTNLTYDRDVAGRIVKAFTNNNPQDPTDDVTVFLRYDTLDNPIFEKRSWANPPAPITWYEYFPPREVIRTFSPGGLLKSLKVDDDAMLREYDSLNRLKKITHKGNLVAEYSYDGLFWPKQVRFGNGVAQTVAYDSLGRLASIENQSAQGVVLRKDEIFYGKDGLPHSTRVTEAGAAPMSSFYSLDAAGRLITEVQQVPDFSGMRTVQLTNEDTEKAIQAVGRGGDWRRYTLDVADNWQARDGSLPGVAVKPKISPLNAYLEFGAKMPARYTPFGALMSLGKNEIYGYNGLGQLLSAQVGANRAEYTYDAFGRIGREIINGTVVKEYVSSGNQMIGELRLDKNIDVEDIIYGRSPENLPLSSWKTWSHTAFGSGLDQPAARTYGAQGERYYYHLDRMGSVTMLSNQWGGVAEKYRYSGFGETAILDPGGSARAESVAGSSLAFQGQFYQPKTGESFMRARWYKPDWGRFLSPDPGLFSGGQNLYAFVGNSPLLFTDPFGLGPTPPRGHIIPGYPGFLTNLYELTGQSSLMRVFDPTGTLGFSSRISVSFLIASTGYGVPGEIIEEAETNLANLNPLYRVSVAMEEAAGAQLEIVEKGWTVGRALNAQVQGLRTGVELLAAGAVVYSGRPGLGMVGEAGVAEAGSALGAGEAAAAAGRPAFLGGKYVHMTNPESFAGIQGERALISRGGIYAGPRTNAQTSGLELSLRTGLSPSSDVPVLIPKAAEGAFFQPLPIGPVTTWQRAMGHVYTPAGILDLNTGVFTRTGLPLTQIKWYLTDILFDLTMLRIILQPVPSGSTAAPPPDNPGR